MGIKAWNRGQLTVFFAALLLAECVMAWKYHDVEARYDSSANVIKTGLEMMQAQRASGIQPSDSFALALNQAVHELTLQGPRVASTQRFVLFLGGLVLPVIGLAVAWNWFSGKPRTS